ncbi:MAG: M48 family metalloprotease [Magnetovibrionaceae bacterium]
MAASSRSLFSANRTFFRGGLLSVFIIVFLVLTVFPAEAQQRRSFIRDAEVEQTLRDYSTPLFQTAGLDPRSVQIYIVKDRSLNAFVAGGQRMFFHTGFLMRTEHPGQVLGVIAHETGHIAGGHLSRTREALAGASAQSIIGTILGGVAVLSGQSDVGAAVLMGSQTAAARNFLQYSRTQEAAADQAGIRYLTSTQQSPRGLLEFFEILEGQELLSRKRQDPYVRSHPLTADRITTLRTAVENSPFADAPHPPGYVERHNRMKAKLAAFIESPVITFRRYKETDQSLESRYARAIAHYRRSEVDQALALMDGLISEHPNDPYFHELRGQILFEAGRGREALPSYQRAADLLPRNSLILGDLARVQIETGDDSLLPTAIENLGIALDQEPRRTLLWRQLGIAHGRLGNQGESSLALGEEALILGKLEDAKFHANRAQQLLPQGSRGWLQASDILNAAGEGEKQ